jgi:chromosome segregation ATPase
MNKEIIDTIRMMQEELTTWKMQPTIKELSDANNSWRIENECLRSEVEGLKGKLVDSQTAFGLMTEQLRELTNENTRLADEYHRERQKVQTISKNFHDASERVTKLMAELTKETDDRVSLQDQLARMVVMSEEQGKRIEHLTWELGQAEGFLKEDTEHIQRLNVDVSAYKGAAELAQDELNELRQTYAVRNEQYQQQCVTISHLQEQIKVLIQRNKNQEEMIGEMMCSSGLIRRSYTAKDVLHGVHIRKKYEDFRKRGIDVSKESEDAEVAAWVEAFNRLLEKEDLTQHTDHRVSIPATILKNPPSTFNPKSKEVLEDLAGRMGESFADEPCASPSCEECEVLSDGVVSVDCGPGLLKNGVDTVGTVFIMGHREE